MNKNQLITYGAVALGVYALIYSMKAPGQKVATTPAQQQRDAGLMKFYDQINSQQVTLGGGLAFSLQNTNSALMDLGVGINNYR